jgi:outer membrane protein assembly factor BamB
VVSSAAAGATLFVGGSSGKVYALAANSGADAAGGLAAPVAPLAGSPALAGSTLLVPTTAGLVALDPTGAKLWSSDLPAATGVAIAGGSLYVGTTDDRLVGFSPGVATPSPPAGTADVAITAIQAPATVSRSADALVTVTLANRGGASSNFSLSLRVQPGNLLIGATTGTLSAGETRGVPFTWATVHGSGWREGAAGAGRAARADGRPSGGQPPHAAGDGGAVTRDAGENEHSGRDQGRPDAKPH